MTRFVGDSIATRQGRGGHTVTGKDLKKSMKVFQETGVHPLIEATREQNAGAALVPLPTLDINRPHIFLDLHHRGRTLGRVVIELFEDLHPVTCATFRHRCLEVRVTRPTAPPLCCKAGTGAGSIALQHRVILHPVQGHHTLKGSSIHKLQPHFAAFGGLLPASAAIAPSTSRPNRLQHTEAGLLSVHKDGSHFALTLARALVLDANYSIVGRVGKGADVLTGLSDIATDIEDAPEGPLTVATCGTTDHRGRNEVFSAAEASGASASDAAAAAKGGMTDVAAGAMDAVAEALKRKAVGKRGTTGGGAAAKRRKGRGTGMGALSDEDESGSDGA